MKKRILSLASIVLVAGAVTFTGCKKDDTTAPVLTLQGDAEKSIDLGDAYTDAGATAEDDRDGDISTAIVKSGDEVNNAKVGTYTVKYNVSDEAGNAATEVSRTVKVKSDKLAGSYNVSDVITNAGSANGTYTYSTTVTQSTTEYNKILFSNFGGFATGTVYATADGSGITIPSQTVPATAGGGSINVTVSGSGTYDGANKKILTITYTASNGLGNGSATYTKQ